MQEDVAALRHLCQTGLNDLMGADALDALALIEHIAGLGVEQTGHRLQGGGLACAVGADEGDDLALVHLEGNILDRVDVAVKDVDVINLQ